jgi:hypothetical protein
VNVVSSGRHKRPSKLLDALRHREQVGGTGHLGFGAVPAPAKRRPALFASLSAIDTSAMKALAQAGADGIEVLVRSEADLKEVRAALPESTVPLGLVLDPASGWLPSSAAELPDIDWIRLWLGTNASVLAWEKPARFMTIPEDLELRRVPAFNTLEIDAVVIDGAWAQTGDLSIEDALRIASLGDIFKKPVFLNVGKGLPAELVSVAKECGVNGLLYQVEVDSAVEAVTAFIKSLEINQSEV